MQEAIKLNINTKPQANKPSIRSNIITLASLSSSVIEKTINVNNTPRHITFNKTIEYNEANSYVERKVIDMNTEIQSEINRMIKKYKNVHLMLFIISVLVMILSWIPKIIPKDISLVLGPLSAAFSLMIIMNYYLRRLK